MEPGCCQSWLGKQQGGSPPKGGGLEGHQPTLEGAGCAVVDCFRAGIRSCFRRHLAQVHVCRRSSFCIPCCLIPILLLVAGEGRSSGPHGQHVIICQEFQSFRHLRALPILSADAKAHWYTPHIMAFRPALRLVINSPQVVSDYL
jgi:hypothetical protein